MYNFSMKIAAEAVSFVAEYECADFWTLLARVHSATEGNETEMCK